MEISLTILLAIFLDRCLGEPKSFHPLIGFGALVKFFEKRFYRDSYWRGVIATISVIIVVVFPCWILWMGLISTIDALGKAMLDQEIAASVIDVLTLIISSIVVYFAIAWRSLVEHANDVAKALADNNLSQARNMAAKILSRDTQNLNHKQISSATIESVLENGNDAIFAAIFWYLVAGLPGVVIFRLVNTLDAMWGYKSPRLIHFGWAAARLDDVMNYIPARLSAFSYAMAGNATSAFRCWLSQAKQWKSPNAGVVMASGAGSLGLCLGGEAVYHGETQWRPKLGQGGEAEFQDIGRALQLLRRAIFIWLSAVIFVEGAWLVVF